MTTAPVNPGPLVMSDSGQPVVVALNLVAETASPPDHGIIAEVFNFANRPDWEGHAAWLVRASGAYEPLVEALKDMFALIDEGFLVRNIENDSNPGWVIEQLPLVKRLSDARAVLDSLAQATGAPEAGDPK